MTRDQALQMLDQAIASLHIPRPAHAQLSQALQVLKVLSDKPDMGNKAVSGDVSKKASE